jgi:hypothetical protein
MPSNPAGRAQIHLRYFLWLSMIYKLLNAAGYMPYSVLTGFGDWIAIVRVLSPAFPWKWVLALLGVALYIWFLRALCTEMGAFIYTSELGWRQRAWLLVLTPYLAAGVVACVAGALSPGDQFGMKKGFIIGASTAFGTARGGFFDCQACWQATVRRMRLFSVPIKYQVFRMLALPALPEAWD